MKKEHYQLMVDTFSTTSFAAWCDYFTEIEIRDVCVIHSSTSTQVWITARWQYPSLIIYPTSLIFAQQIIDFLQKTEILFL